MLFQREKVIDSLNRGDVLSIISTKGDVDLLKRTGELSEVYRISISGMKLNLEILLVLNDTSDGGARKSHVLHFCGICLV